MRKLGLVIIALAIAIPLLLSGGEEESEQAAKPARENEADRSFTTTSWVLPDPTLPRQVKSRLSDLEEERQRNLAETAAGLNGVEVIQPMPEDPK